MQPGEGAMPCADTQKLRSQVGFEASNTLDAGLERFMAWSTAWKVTSISRR